MHVFIKSVHKAATIYIRTVSSVFAVFANQICFSIVIFSYKLGCYRVYPYNSLISISTAAITFQFSLSSTEFPSIILIREFSFTLFDCNFHSNCSSCVSQSDTSECGWCPYSGECTHSDTLCPLTISMGGQVEYVWIEDDTCPVLNVDSSTDSFAVESSHSIILQGSNLQPPEVCLFSIYLA